MRNLIAGLFLALVMVVGNQSQAQAQYKFGHIDSQQLLQIMPERKAAEQEMEAYAKQLESQMSTMQVEFERKYNDYVNLKDSLKSGLIVQTKEAELGEMQQRIQVFQQTAQQELQAKEGQLLQPIIAKAKQAISDVATENNYTYVFDIGTGVLLHWSADSEDILPLVKAKLGIQ